jgi:hypothetical protein
MKVHVQVSGLPSLYEAFLSNESVEIQFPGKTFGELIDAMIGKFGSGVRKASSIKMVISTQGLGYSSKE